jgi:hypothetical protein
MSELERRGSRLPRRARERRAFQLVMVGGAAGLVAVVGLLLAILDVIGLGLPIVAAIVAVVCLVLFRRTVGG